MKTIAFAAAWMLLSGAWIVTRAQAGPIGAGFAVSGRGAKFPDAAYNSRNGNYLVVWGDYARRPCGVGGRLVSGDGTPRDEPFVVSDGSAYALCPAVAYNAADNEFLAVWIDGRGDRVYGRRLDGATGAAAGTPFAISEGAKSLCSVAWSSKSNCYLVVYYGAAGSVDVYGRRVGHDGAMLGRELNISSDADYSGYPDVAYGSRSDEFLVTWDHEDKAGARNIHAQRVRANADELSGPRIRVTTDSAKDRSCVAFDSVNFQWLVQFNDCRRIATHSYDQSAQAVGAGGPVGGLRPIAATSVMEGDTQRHGGLSFAPGARRFFASFPMGGEMAGQELDEAGRAIGGPVNLSDNPPGTEAFSCANAADSNRNRFLAVWESFDGSAGVIRGRLYAPAAATR